MNTKVLPDVKANCKHFLHLLLNVMMVGVNSMDLASVNLIIVYCSKIYKYKIYLMQTIKMTDLTHLVKVPFPRKPKL